MFFLESPIAVAAVGVFCVVLAAIPYLQTHSRWSVARLALTTTLAIAAMIGERLWVTPKERVRSELSAMFAAIEGNDLVTVLTHIDPAAAEVRSDAESLMPRLRVERAGQGGDVRVELPTGNTATVALKPLIKVVDKRSGATVGYYDDLTIDFARRGERWLVVDYRPATEWSPGR